MEPPLPYLVFAVIEQISANDPGVRQNFDIPAFLVLQRFLITGVSEEQAHPVSLEANRGIVGQHIKDNHVTGLLIEPGQIQVVMAFVILRSGLDIYIPSGVLLPFLHTEVHHCSRSVYTAFYAIPQLCNLPIPSE